MLTLVTRSKIVGQDQIQMAHRGCYCAHNFIVGVIIIYGSNLMDYILEWSEVKIR